MTSKRKTDDQTGKQTKWEVFPGQDYREFIPNLKPGDELILHEGVYEGALNIKVSGHPDNPIRIRGYGKGEQRPVLLYEGDTANLWEIHGDFIEVSFLEFRPVSINVQAIRIGDIKREESRGIIIRDCIFRECGGECITANNSNINYQDIRILNNRFLGVQATSVYIGQHFGKSPVTGFIFEDNFIDGTRISRDNIVGYGIELKLNVKGGIIRNNLIINTKGPGIMVYGAEDGIFSDANIVEGNIVVGSRNWAGIVAGAGPSILKNNVVLGCLTGGLLVYDYNGWGLMHDIIVSDNTCACSNNFDLAFRDMDSADTSLQALRNIAISKNDVIGLENVNARDFPGKSEGNRVFAATSQLEEMVEAAGEPDSYGERIGCMDRVWMEMKKGPFDPEGLIGLLELLLSHQGGKR